jgi:hypothetical protein
MPKSVPLGQYPGPGTLAVKIPWIGDHFGPGSGAGNYQQNGYSITAQQLGMSRIEWVQFSPLSQSGNYYAVVNYIAPGGNQTANKNELQAVGFAQIYALWYYAANNVQVANNTALDGECVQLFAIGQ